MKLPEDPRETRALEALITAALHPFGLDSDVSEEEVCEFLGSGPTLTEAQRAALDRLGLDPLRWLSRQPEEKSTRVREDAFAAMHRHGSDEGLDEETRLEIERKRQEILKRLEERKKSGEEPRN